MMRFVRPGLDLLLPPRCPLSGEMVSDTNSFSPSSWSKLNFISAPQCKSCGKPMGDEAAGEELICASCIQTPPIHDGIRAVVVYDEFSRPIVLRLKHAGRIGLASFIAHFLDSRISDMPDDTLIIPVPLHRWRIWRRGFNQAQLIGRALAKLTGMEMRDDLLMRVKPTPPLKQMRARERAKAVSGAFAVSDDAKRIVSGRTILLVDDVYTTGATANSCVRLLKGAGANRVVIACWARVLATGET
ncbi:ComF family protein [Alterisphingorhabdus coralli]|uniref:ComF family protein n=1 Tax=Alterisphingorhabdus coralli TaxID=3071408 RepID=A0AA97HZX5_9SPHN|nr:ComF family protein [Parasphingorhabdus sp. SCSIO 66989]WOE74297.1 ComF family protein [Parasphingorhabdus sp. SCSIO 66989]